MLGACHVMACVLWYVGTYNLPLTNGICNASDTDSEAVNPDPTCQDYDDRLSRHWLSGYSGDDCTYSFLTQLVLLTRAACKIVLPLLHH